MAQQENTQKIDLFISRSETPLEQQLAQSLLSPEAQAANTLKKTFPDTDDTMQTSALFLELEEQTKALNEGNSTNAQKHLGSQAITLNAISNDLMRKALSTDQFHLLEGYMKLALKAQAQARQTWETLSTIQNPPLANYIGQQNVAYNQQVNNSDTARIENPPNELLEQDYGQRLDTRETCKASRDDQAVEAMGEVHRAKNRGRAGKIGKE